MTRMIQTSIGAATYIVASCFIGGGVGTYTDNSALGAITFGVCIAVLGLVLIFNRTED